MEKQKLFVGNLNFETTKEEIRELFSAFGMSILSECGPKKDSPLLKCPFLFNFFATE